MVTGHLTKYNVLLQYQINNKMLSNVAERNKINTIFNTLTNIKIISKCLITILETKNYLVIAMAF